MSTTKYADTFWNSTDADSITAGTKVYAGSTVEIVGEQVGIFVPVKFVDADGTAWFKHVEVTGLA